MGKFCKTSLLIDSKTFHSQDKQAQINGLRMRSVHEMYSMIYYLQRSLGFAYLVHEINNPLVFFEKIKEKGLKIVLTEGGLFFQSMLARVA